MGLSLHVIDNRPLLLRNENRQVLLQMKRSVHEKIRRCTTGGHLLPNTHARCEPMCCNVALLGVHFEANSFAQKEQLLCLPIGDSMRIFGAALLADVTRALVDRG